MHKIYRTKAFILDTLNVGEANKFYWMLTKDLGLVYATAQGIRKDDSKLRYNLQQYSLCEIELVAGRDVWRITNVDSVNGFSFMGLGEKSKKIVARLSTLLKRLFVGEEAHPDLFEDLQKSLSGLMYANNPQETESVETLTVLKILHHLGYWEEHEEHYPLHVSPFSKEALEETLKNKKQIVQRINKSLRQTGL